MQQLTMQGNTANNTGMLKWLFTKVKTVLHSLLPMTRNYKEKKLLTECLLLTNCRELTIAQFEQCYIHNNLSCLVISGNPTDAQINMAWGNIQHEYCDLTGDEDFRDFVKNKSKELREVLRMHHIRLLVAHVYWRYDEIYIDALKKYGFDEADGYSYPTNDIDAYHACLDRILNSFIHEEIIIEKLQDSIKSYIDAHKGSKTKDGFFDENLARLTAGLKLGFMLTKNITVSDYAVYLTMYRQRIEQEKHSHGRG